MSVKESLDSISKRWNIEKAIYDLHIGKRNDIVDTQIRVNGTVFHIPTLTNDNRYVLWRCLWPDCHNCCERQGRLPLTKDDLFGLSKKTGYKSVSDFVKNETGISSWDENEGFGNIITSITMLSLKRDKNEKEDQDGTPLRCRFLDDSGYCKVHPDKPGVCWLYPFTSWVESEKGIPVVHATFQFTGDCPGFYTSTDIDDMMPVLKEYSKKIYDYNMSVNRTTRENYGFINFVDLNSDPDNNSNSIQQ